MTKIIIFENNNYLTIIIGVGAIHFYNNFFTPSALRLFVSNLIAIYLNIASRDLAISFPTKL